MPLISGDCVLRQQTANHDWYAQGHELAPVTTDPQLAIPQATIAQMEPKNTQSAA